MKTERIGRFGSTIFSPINRSLAQTRIGHALAAEYGMLPLFPACSGGAKRWPRSCRAGARFSREIKKMPYLL